MKDEFEPLSGIDCRVNVTKGLLILAALVFGVAVFVG
jgi:hypothetical protein